jgi:hypothetical protein
MQPTDVLEVHPTLGRHVRVIDYGNSSLQDLATLRRTQHLLPNLESILSLHFSGLLPESSVPVSPLRLKTLDVELMKPDEPSYRGSHTQDIPLSVVFDLQSLKKLCITFHSTLRSDIFGLGSTFALPNLRSLSLRLFRDVDSPLMLAFLRLASGLQTLAFHACAAQPPVAIPPGILDSMPRLRSLSLDEVNIRSAFAQPLRQLVTVEADMEDDLREIIDLFRSSPERLPSLTVIQTAERFICRNASAPQAYLERIMCTPLARDARTAGLRFQDSDGIEWKSAWDTNA